MSSIIFINFVTTHPPYLYIYLSLKFNKMFNTIPTNADKVKDDITTLPNVNVNPPKPIISITAIIIKFLKDLCDLLFIILLKPTQAIIQYNWRDIPPITQAGTDWIVALNIPANDNIIANIAVLLNILGS